MLSCILCGDKGGMDRLCGFDVCPLCRTGMGIEARLEGLGIGAETRAWTEMQKRGDNQVQVYLIEVILRLPQPIDATAHFGKGPTSGHDASHPDPDASAWQRLRHWMNPQDLQVGDCLFDDAVFISEPQGDDLLPLLQDEGVQSAVMELVAAGGVRLGDGWLRARRSSTISPPSVAEHTVVTALFAQHILTYLALRGA